MELFIIAIIVVVWLVAESIRSVYENLPFENEDVKRVCKDVRSGVVEWFTRDYNYEVPPVAPEVNANIEALDQAVKKCLKNMKRD